MPLVPVEIIGKHPHTGKRGKVSVNDDGKVAVIAPLGIGEPDMVQVDFDDGAGMGVDACFASVKNLRRLDVSQSVRRAVGQKKHRTGKGHLDDTRERTPGDSARIEQWLSRYYFSGADYSTESIKGMIEEEVGIRVWPTEIRRKLQKIAERATDEELRRRGESRESLYAQHRGLRKSLVVGAVEDRNWSAANQAADKLMVLDGIAPELIRVDKVIQQMSEPELLRFIEGLVSTITAQVLAKAMGPAQLETFWRALSEDQRCCLRELQQQRPAITGGAVSDGPGRIGEAAEAPNSADVGDDL